MNTKVQFRKNVDIDSIIKRLLQVKTYNSLSQFPLKQEQIDCLCGSVRNILSTQPMLLQLNAPVTIVGDIHGQFFDFTHMMQIMGTPNVTNYLFLGDYVDRGKKSLESFCLLMAYKIKFPNTFFFLKGNHQCSQINKIYGFYDQCKRKFNVKLWKNVSATFDWLPIAAVVGNRIFCVHGGLSPNLKNIAQLNNIKRPIQPPRGSVMCDLLWSDPSPTTQGWTSNNQRGISFYFGRKIIQNFLEKYDFDLICRSHQVVEEGFEFLYDKKLVTIFSAPNYCGQFQNLGAVLKVDKLMNCQIKQFNAHVPALIIKVKRSITPLPRKSDNKTDSLKNSKQNSLQKKSLKCQELSKQNIQKQQICYQKKRGRKTTQSLIVGSPQNYNQKEDWRSQKNINLAQYHQIGEIKK